MKRLSTLAPLLVCACMVVCAQAPIGTMEGQITDPTAARTITFPNASGTVAVSATGPITLSAAGDIGCATCVTSIPTVTLQTAYNNGATITTAASTPIAFTLTSGNFTATGAGSVNLTPTGASSFTSGAALTLTGGAASTWSTSSGALTLDAAAALNLGTANATSIALGRTGITTTHRRKSACL